jgi:hypothetical protein
VAVIRLKLFKFEVSLSQPALVVFVIGCMLMVIPLFTMPGASEMAIGIDSLALTTPETVKSGESDLSSAATYFCIGYDFYYVAYTAILVTDPENDAASAATFSDTYDSCVHYLNQELEQSFIYIDIPDDISWLDIKEVPNFFFDIESELSSKLKAEDPLSPYPYYYGKWTSGIQFTVSTLIGRDKQSIQNSLQTIIDTFENDIRQYTNFDIGDEIKAEFNLLILDLKSLRRAGSVDKNDFIDIVNQSEGIYELIKAQRTYY